MNAGNQNSRNTGKKHMNWMSRLLQSYRNWKRKNYTKQVFSYSTWMLEGMIRERRGEKELDCLELLIRILTRGLNSSLKSSKKNVEERKFSCVREFFEPFLQNPKGCHGGWGDPTGTQSYRIPPNYFVPNKPELCISNKTEISVWLTDNEPAKRRCPVAVLAVHGWAGHTTWE